jgi:hypothetical protein
MGKRGAVVSLLDRRFGKRQTIRAAPPGTADVPLAATAAPPLEIF